MEFLAEKTLSSRLFLLYVADRQSTTALAVRVHIVKKTPAGSESSLACLL